MGFKKSVGWADISINPITGCLNNCNYCYARKMACRLKGRFGYSQDEPFKPTFHPDRLQDIYNLCGPHKRVFLDSMGDWFGPGVDPDWVRASINAIRDRSRHTFLVLTKSPQNIRSYTDMYWDIPSNLWLGVTVTNNSDLWRLVEIRSEVDSEVHKFVSFEPLLNRIHPDFLDLTDFEWVIIGAESGNRKGKIVPEVEWIRQICESARGKPVFLKDNLRSVLSMGQLPLVELRQEFPEVMN